MRNRPPVTITLSPEALARLDAIAAERGQTRSGAIEGLVRNARVGDKAIPPMSAKALRLGLRDIGVDIAEFGLLDPAYVVRRAAATVDRLDPAEVSATSILGSPRPRPEEMENRNDVA
jgi:hypothetical protein